MSDEGRSGPFAIVSCLLQHKVRVLVEQQRWIEIGIISMSPNSGANDACARCPVLMMQEKTKVTPREENRWESGERRTEVTQGLLFFFSQRIDNIFLLS